MNLRVAGDPGARRITEAARAVNAGDRRRALRGRRHVRRIGRRGRPSRASSTSPAPWSDVGDALLERWWRARVAAERRLRAPRDADVPPRPARRRCRRRATAPQLARALRRTTRARGCSASRACAASPRARTRSTIGCSRACAPRPRGARGRRRGRSSCPGAPVSVQRNDYERGLYNGDQGRRRPTVGRRRRPADADEPMAVFPARLDVRGVPARRSSGAAPAFAMTVHKAQGSEFDHVALVLPDADMPLLTRELLYTAMTRARRSVLLVGDGDLLARAVSRTVERSSGVAARLRKTR